MHRFTSSRVEIATGILKLRYEMIGPEFIL